MSKYFGICSALLLLAMSGCYLDSQTSTPTPEVIESDCKQVAVTIVNSVKVQQEAFAKYKEEHPYSITTHRGGKELPHDEMREMIQQIVADLPNIKYDRNTVDLITETLIVETRMGGAKYHAAAKNWGNYGIAQFCKGTAQRIMKVLKKQRPDVYAKIDKMYNHKLSMTENLLTNVPFSIALVAEYYWLTDPKFNNKISTRTARARVWKKFYNTEAGAGTVAGYQKAVSTYYAKL